MSKAKWIWLTPLLLAAYALAYVSWIPPHAVLTQAFPMNATHFAAYMNNIMVYITQANLSFYGPPAEAQAIMQYLYSQCRYMAVDVLNAVQISENEQLWFADVYCTADGSMWLWLRWLPLRFTAYSGYVEFINATGATAVTPVGTFSGYIPAGWYLDPTTKAVFRVPEANLTLLMHVATLSAQIETLKAELNKSKADVNQTALLIARLEAQLTALEAQRRALEDALRQRESEVTALQANLRAAQAENDRLRSQLAQLKAENDQLKAQLTSMNQTIASLNDQLAAMMMQAFQTSDGEEGIDPLMYVLFTALAGVVAAFVIYKKKMAEE